MSTTITVYGAGYVGLVTGVCLADFGNDVLVMDVDEAKIALLQRGTVPFFEPGLNELLLRNISSGRIQFTGDIAQAVNHGLIQFIAVGTPSAADDSADLRYVYAVAKDIAAHMAAYRFVVLKSTVPVGTTLQVKQIISDQLQQRGLTIAFDVASNPEFLKQGAAIQDFMQPARVIIGTESAKAEAILRELYAPLDDTGNKIIAMDIASAELTKYAANAFLATKISFINEISRIAENVGANIDKVRVGIGTDPRISPKFLMPGCGFGGSCFPKDVRALKKMGEQVGVKPALLQAVEEVNEAQKRLLFTKLSKYFNGQLTGRRIALWGLAFKAGTDDMREASSCVLLAQLWQAGIQVQAYDPIAMPTARQLYGKHEKLVLCEKLEDSLIGADALMIVTEWDEFRSPNFTFIKQQLNRPAIFDGRNLFMPEQMQREGFDYYSIGRGNESYPLANGKIAVASSAE